VDIVDVVVAPEIEVDLPLHPLQLETALFERGSSIAPWFDVGYDDIVVHETQGPVEVLRCAGGHEVLLPSRSGEHILLVSGPGLPTLALGRGEDHVFPMRSCSGPGRWVQVFSAQRERVRTVRTEGDTVHVHHTGGVASLCLQNRTVVVTDNAETLVLGGIREFSVDVGPVRVPLHQSVTWPLFERAPSGEEVETALRTQGISMGGESYRRSERNYPGEDVFSARCCLFGVARQLHVIIDVTKADLWFRPKDWPDPMLDNEAADINSDSVQFYLQPPSTRHGHGADFAGWSGYLIQPFESRDHRPKIRAIRGTAARVEDIDGRIELTSEGYRITATYECTEALRSGSSFLFNVVVNEMYAGRQRRAGQLSLTGGGWVYLRGDRENPWDAFVGTLA